MRMSVATYHPGQIAIFGIVLTMIAVLALATTTYMFRESNPLPLTAPMIAPLPAEAPVIAPVKIVPDFDTHGAYEDAPHVDNLYQVNPLFFPQHDPESQSGMTGSLSVSP